MTIEQIWVLMGIIGASTLYYFFSVHLIIGGIIGAFIGFLITTTMKLMRYKFEKSGDYSSSNRSSSCDDWDY